MFKIFEIKSYYPQVLAKLTASSQSNLHLVQSLLERTRQTNTEACFYMPRMFEDRKQWEWNYCGNKRRNKVAIEVSKEPLETVFLPRRQPT